MSLPVGYFLSRCTKVVVWFETVGLVLHSRTLIMWDVDVRVLFISSQIKRISSFRVFSINGIIDTCLKWIRKEDIKAFASPVNQLTRECYVEMLTDTCSLRIWCILLTNWFRQHKATNHTCVYGDDMLFKHYSRKINFLKGGHGSPAKLHRN